MAYLTADEYLDRYTAIEATRLTDVTKAGSPDLDRIDTAIADMSGTADAYLASRYALPIASPPELLKGIVADLTRERLHGSKVTQLVTDNADRARTLLRDLAAGRANIPAPPNGTPPVETASGSPISSKDARGRVFTDAALADFTGFGLGGGGTVFSGPRDY